MNAFIASPLRPYPLGIRDAYPWEIGGRSGGQTVLSGGYGCPESIARLIARKAFKARQKKKNSFRVYRRFALTVYFSSRGDVTIGCKHIQWGQISCMGRKRGWFK